MRRIIQWLNFLGVLILAALCCLQWSANQRLNDTISRLDQTRRDQAATLADQSQQLKDGIAELSALQDRLDLSEAARHADESKLATLHSERDRLATESARLKKTLQAWVDACAARDTAIKQANATITGLSARYIDAVRKYNDLVAKYNRLTNPLLSAQTKP